MSDKIDLKGNYLPFYGYTVICMVSDRKGAPTHWEEYLQKAPTLRAHMAPLPSSSYHATIYDIFTQRKVPARYTSKSGLVPSSHWSSAYNMLQQDMSLAEDVCEKVKGNIQFLKKQFIIGCHPGNSIMIEGTLSNSEEVSIIEGELKNIFGDIGKSVIVHHITLGYIFKEVGDDDLKRIKEELKNLWDKVHDEIFLDTPSVHYFETMTEFLPFKDVPK
ncbi:hypothetical protein RRG08_008803 [Elysia crispata]|uniref:DUF1868 domain-containing protein n=1 Tax=Elysia crispata TaxID=231223 RepID=A0AAE0Z954_9GAST|nr:hypothetical protein RRG08_008803 [Elysia crispata]